MLRQHVQEQHAIHIYRGMPRASPSCFESACVFPLGLKKIGLTKEITSYVNVFWSLESFGNRFVQGGVEL